MKILLVAALIFALFIILDLIWFSVAGNFFKNEVGSIARLAADGSWNVRYLPAALVYILMTIGLFVFVFPQAPTLVSAFLFGALFGFIAYGIYDLTNLATLSAWTVKFVVVDMVWGAFLCGVVATCARALS
jgi:uncharacterized membrane protein